MTTNSIQQPIAKVFEYWRLIIRYKWQMLIGTSACMLAFTVGVKKLPNEYEATTTILVDPQQVPEKYVSPAVTSDPSERLNTLTQEVLSRTRLQEIMSKFNLYSNLAGKIPQEELIQQMQDHIRIQVRQGSGPQLSTFTISFQGSNPVTVAAVANELAASFIRWNINSREQQVEGTQAFLAEELQNAKKNLEEQENKLRVFKMSHLGETPDQTTGNLEAIAALRSSLQATIDSCSRLEQERVLLSRLPESVVAAGTPEAPLTKRGRLELEKQQVETEVQQLRAGHSDRYPDIVRLKRRLEDITGTLNSLPPDVSAGGSTTAEVSAASVRLELLDKELKRVKGEQARIQSQIASYQAKVDAAPLREQQLVELTRNYDVSKQHYQTLLDKSFNIEMAASLEQKQKGERFTVLDPARVPERPVKPRRKLLLAFAALLALVLPCVFALSQEVWKNAITTESELKSLVPAGVRIVGLIPKIETPANRRSDLRMGLAASLVTLLLFASAAWVVWQMRPWL
jgi:succinoglycan biosynthesis transport protein ExoP